MCVNRGAYVISDMKDYDKILIGTGSEVSLLLNVQDELLKEGIKTRVVSMPSMNIFENQDKAYKDEVLGVGKLCKKDKYFVEMASAFEGYKYAANLINITDFGTSAKEVDVLEGYGFTTSSIVSKIIK